MGRPDFVGHPSSQAPVPTALGSRETFNVLIESTPGANAVVAADTARVRPPRAADRVPPRKSVEKKNRRRKKDRRFSGI
jgi:hypothetical protein